MTAAWKIRLSNPRVCAGKRQPWPPYCPSFTNEELAGEIWGLFLWAGLFPETALFAHEHILLHTNENFDLPIYLLVLYNRCLRFSCLHNIKVHMMETLKSNSLKKNKTSLILDIFIWLYKNFVTICKGEDNNEKINSCSIIIEHLPSVMHCAKHLRSDNPFNHSQNTISWKLKGWPCKLVNQGSEVLNDLSQLIDFRIGIPINFCATCDSHAMQVSLVKRHGVPNLEHEAATAGPGGGVATESHLLGLAICCTHAALIEMWVGLRISWCVCTFVCSYVCMYVWLMCMDIHVYVSITCVPACMCTVLMYCECICICMYLCEHMYMLCVLHAVSAHACILVSMCLSVWRWEGRLWHKLFWSVLQKSSLRCSDYLNTGLWI